MNEQQQIIWPQGQLLEGISEADYDAAPGFRSTELKHGIRSSAHYKAYKDGPAFDSAALSLGRLVHLAILEPRRFQDTVVIEPDLGRRTPKVKEQLESWRQGLAKDAVVATAEDLEVARGIHHVVYSHPFLAPLFAEGKREASLFWHDDEFNAPMKCRADFVSSQGHVVDIKTTKDASYSSFARDCVTYSYNLSASHYLEGMRATGCGNAEQFIIVACEKTPPYGVMVYDLSEAAIERGRKWRRHALANILKAQRTGIYDGYPQHPVTLEEPGWAPQCLDVEVT